MIGRKGTASVGRRRLVGPPGIPPAIRTAETQRGPRRRSRDLSVRRQSDRSVPSGSLVTWEAPGRKPRTYVLALPQRRGRGIRYTSGDEGPSSHRRPEPSWRAPGSIRVHLGRQRFRPVEVRSRLALPARDQPWATTRAGYDRPVVGARAPRPNRGSGRPEGSRP